MRCPLLLIMLLLLTACGGPREPIFTAEKAMAERRVFHLRVLAIYDDIEVRGMTQGSHLIEVEVLDGAPEYAGRIITLPYDEWAVGHAPPKPGTTMHISPCAWMTNAPASHGKPLDGWDGSVEHQKLH